MRTASKLPSDIVHNEHVSVVSGDLSDYTKLYDAMSQHRVTTVVSFLGAYISASAIVTRSKETPIADSFPIIMNAMRASGVKHMMTLSTPSYWVEEKDVATWTLSMYGLMPKILAPQGNAEMIGIAKHVAAADPSTEWTIFRIPHLTDGPADLPVYAGYAGPSNEGSLSLSRRSMARWVLGEIHEQKWTREAPLLGNK